MGGCRRRVPAYASGALMRPVSPERLAEIGPMLVEKGFRQLKTQMGGEALATREVERIRTLREAVGDGSVDVVMIDLVRVGGITPWRFRTNRGWDWPSTGKCCGISPWTSLPPQVEEARRRPQPEKKRMA